MITRILWLAGLLTCAACGDPDAGKQRGDNPSPAAGNQQAPRSAWAAGLVPQGAVVGSDARTGEGQVISFDSREEPARLLAWYRSPERRAHFRLASDLQEGAERVLTGATARPRAEFTVRLAPGAKGGTTAMVMVTER